MPAMTVARLIEVLSEYPEDAVVHIMTQESWPFENTIAGVVSREEFLDHDEELDEMDIKEGRKTTDVFLLEGSQLRYGRKDAWQVCRR